MYLRGSAVLRNAAGDSDGGGGSSDDEAPVFTEKQLAALATLIGQTTNQAVTAQLKRNLPTAVADGVKSLNFEDILAPVIAKMKPTGEAPDEGTKPNKKTQDPEVQKMLQDLSAKLEASEAKALASERARVEADQKRMRDQAVTTLRNELQPKLRGELLDVAVSHWADVQGRLKVNDEGIATFRVKRAAFKGGPEQEEDLPLAEAIPFLLASAEAKPFIPAPGGQLDKGGPAVKPKISFVNGTQQLDSNLSDTAKAQAALEALQKLGIDDPSAVLG